MTSCNLGLFRPPSPLYQTKIIVLRRPVYMLPPCHFIQGQNMIVTLISKTYRPNHSDTKKLDHFIISNLNMLTL